MFSEAFPNVETFVKLWIFIVALYLDDSCPYQMSLSYFPLSVLTEYGNKNHFVSFSLHFCVVPI